MQNETMKGLSCRGCFHCLTRVFRNGKVLGEWYTENEVFKMDNILIKWGHEVRSKEGLRLYWCKIDSPINPVSTPPWWGKHAITGCLQRE